MRRFARYLLTCSAAVLMLGTTVPGAHADYPPNQEQAVVSCPTDAQVNAVLDGVTNTSTRQAHRCSYERVDGQVVYEFTRDTLSSLASLRTSAEATAGFIDFPTVEGFGYQQTAGSFEVFFPVGDEVMHLRLPTAKTGNGLELAELFKNSTRPWAGITIAPIPVTPACPSARAVSRVTKQMYNVLPGDKYDCEYTRGDGTRVRYDVDAFFGSIAEARVLTETRLKGGEDVWTRDFAGLGEGAYYTSISGFTSLHWQESDGVVVELVSQEDLDTNRRLASLYNSVQTSNGSAEPPSPRPTKPGLPSTGN